MTATGEFDPNKPTEDELWTDAWRIAWVGASNPVAVAATLRRHSQGLLHDLGTDGVERHPALQAIAGHLAALFHQGLGPSDEVCGLVIEHAKRLGLMDATAFESALARPDPR